MAKKLHLQKHRSAGDGIGISNTKRQLLRLLLTPTYSAVSCDGYKASLLEKAFSQHLLAGKNHFVIIGHPKLESAYSYDKLENFLSRRSKQGHHFTSVSEVFGNQLP